MTLSLQDSHAKLEALLNAREDEHVEFKEAKQSFNPDKLCRYCCALANERGGTLILGVTDKQPRKIVGTRAFEEVGPLKRMVYEALDLRIEVSEVAHPAGRVLLIEIPSRPTGQPVRYRDVYLMRVGDSVVSIPPDQLRRIFAEIETDFSRRIAAGAGLEHLDPKYVEDLRVRCAAKSGNERLRGLSHEQFLEDIGLLDGGKVTYAALILLGTHKTLMRFLPNAELIFEYRSGDASGPAQQRVNFLEGFMLYQDRIWSLVNARNDLQHFQEGLFVSSVPTFEEGSVREAILNAISHRDYALQGSVFVRQHPRHIIFTSPGGLPYGVTIENIIDRQNPRNRLLADTLERCGLVERSGQGLNLIYEEAIKHAKPLPNFHGTDTTQTQLTLPSEVQDPGFLRYLNQIGQQRLKTFSTQDLLALSYVHREEKIIPDELRPNVQKLRELGAIEAIGKGRGQRLLLSRELYTSIGKPGVYTRKRGLDHETNKELLAKHLAGNISVGCPMNELQAVLPSLPRSAVRRLLQELRLEGRIVLKGSRRGARWFSMQG